MPALAAVVLVLGGGTAAGARPGAGGAPRAGAAGVISTVAGGVGGPAKATTVALNGACGVSFGAGHLYIGDNSSVREIAPGTGELTTPAGTSALVALGDGGPATEARLNSACGVAVDAPGNLLIADSGSDLIQVVAASTGTFYGQPMTAGDIYTVAGNGVPGSSGDGGPATSAELDQPGGVAVDAAGNLLIADTYNSRVRVVAETTGTFYGQAMTAGDIYTVAGNGVPGSSGDGGPATSAELAKAFGVAVDAAGNVLIADTGNSQVRVVAESTGTFYGLAMTAGDIYTVAGGGRGGLGDGGPATSAELDQPDGVAVDAAGNVVIADTYNHRVRVVAESAGTFYGRAMTAGDIYTVAGTGKAGSSGTGGPATSAEIKYPDSVAVDTAGNLVIADSGGLRVKVVAESTATFYGKAMTAGDIYTVAGTGHSFFSGDGGPATHAELNNPDSVGVDAAGNLLIADTVNNRVRVVAKTTGIFYGRAMTARDIYTVAGNGVPGSSGDGGPATSAELDYPSGLAVDAAGNLLIADSGSGLVRVVAESAGTFYGQPMTAGDIYTVAGGGTGGLGDGGPATSAELNYPVGLALDADGDLLIADYYNNRVRMVAARTGTFYGQAMTAGDIYTVAGTGAFGYSGDDGPATSAELDQPWGAAVDAAGNLLFAANGRVRVVAARTGTFYGLPMTAGDIYTVAGGGGGAGTGDGGPATSASLSPVAVAVDAAGNLLIAETGNNRIRMVTG